MPTPHRDSVDACLRTVFEGARWLVVADVLQGALRRAEALNALGAESCLAVGARMGAGALADPSAELSWCCLGLGPSTDTMQAIRTADAALADLPEPVVEAIDAFDPQGTARAVGMIFSSGAPVAGRSMFGARRDSWQALEDKVTIDALWDRVGVERAPVEVVSVDPATLARTSARLDLGDGVVWAGDAREGFNGGASYTWRVRDSVGGDASAALAFLGPRCDRVRVMPFLEGIPCSIHGLVFDADVVVLRPAEMVVVRHPGPHGFRYMRASTFWDPPPEDRAQMRQIAASVGAQLRREVGYRGAFTIDGVLTDRGFRPTGSTRGSEPPCG